MLNNLAEETKKPVVLIIADGYGLSASWQGNAINAAGDYFGRLWNGYSHGVLKSSYLENPYQAYSVIGSGKLAEAESISFQKISASSSLVNAIDTVKRNNASIHFFHNLDHEKNDDLISLLRFAKKSSIYNCYIHLFIDQTFVDIETAGEKVFELERDLEASDLGDISTITGTEQALTSPNELINIIFIKQGKTALTTNQALIRQKDLKPCELSPTAIKFRTDSKIKDFDLIVYSGRRDDKIEEFLKQVILASKANYLPGRPMFLKFISLYRFPFDLKANLDFILDEKPIYTITDKMIEKGKKHLLILDRQNRSNLEYYFVGNRKIEEKVISKKSSGPSSQTISATDLIASTALSEIKKNNYDLMTINFCALYQYCLAGLFSEAILEVKRIDKALETLVKEITDRDGYLVFCSAFGGAENMVADKQKIGNNGMVNSAAGYLPMLIVSNETKLSQSNTNMVAEILNTKEDLSFINKLLEVLIFG